MSNHNFIPFRITAVTWILVAVSSIPMFIAFANGEPDDVINSKGAGVGFCLLAGFLIDLLFWFAKNWEEP